MSDPTTDNGLGLDPATVAHMVGHDDGGYLIATVYTKLSQRRALARAQQAMGAYEQRLVTTIGLCRSANQEVATVVRGMTSFLGPRVSSTLRTGSNTCRN